MSTASPIKEQVLCRVQTAPSGHVWTPADFADLGDRDVIDKTLQRLAKAGDIRRIGHGLYDRPRRNALTRKLAYPGYQEVLAALSRRDRIRMLVDGMTAANDLGLTDAVPAHVVVHTDARRRSINVGSLKIMFKPTAPSKLYWADRPAMRVVQALHWLKDMLPSEEHRLKARLSVILQDPRHGAAIREDLRAGFDVLPGWMQRFLRPLLDNPGTTERPKRRRPKAAISPRTRKAAVR